MANISRILEILNTLPPVYNVPPITPTFNPNGPTLPPGLAPARPVPLIAPAPNTPEYGGPSMVTEPPTAPLDNRIVAQYLSALGPAPTPPRPPSRLDRIVAALGGFAAGAGGYGPQYLESLRRPQLEYQ